jgi:signal transduction histidine kinase
VRFDPRRRFRDRLLIGMVAVALLPLAAFAALAAFELDAVSRGTAAAAQGAILQDEQQRQEGSVNASAQLIERRLAEIDIDLTQLVAAAQRSVVPSAPHPLPPGLLHLGLSLYAGGAGAASTVLLPASPTAADLRAVDASAALVTQMQSVRHSYPEVESVWIADGSDTALRAVPGFNVAAAFAAGRITSPGAAPYWSLPFTQSRKAFDSPTTGWQDPPGIDAQARPYWTDPYPLLGTGDSGVTAWLPVPGTADVVGIDVSVGALIAPAINAAEASQLPAGAYPLLLSSTGTIIGAGGGVTLDFNVTPSPTGSPLPPPADTAFRDALTHLEQNGKATTLTATLGGVRKDVFASPVDAARWLMLRPVPLSALEPDLSSLTHGITAGVHQLFPLMVLPVLLLLLFLAFCAANILAGRLVRPVRRLTAAAGALAGGQTDVPVPQQGRDEVGVLASTLETLRVETNSQREEILAAAAQLEGRVAQRTLELRARNDELVALNALAASLTRSLDSGLILQDALDAVRAIHPMQCGRGYVMEGDRLNAASSWPPGAAPVDGLDAVAAEAVHRNRPMRRAAAKGTLLGWPLATRQGSVGALAVLTEQAPKLGTRRLLQAVADQVALALRTSRLSAAGRDHAVLEERTRLAREIHDTLAQQLTGIVIQLEAAGTLIERGSSRAGQSVQIARDLARSALQEARRSVWNLRPAPLSATGLLGAIQREAEAWEARTGIPARVRTRSVPPRPALHPAGEVALLRVVQEALSNVANHAHATRVDITIRSDRGELVVSVRDNGQGFDPSAERPREDCFGLDGMRERVRSAGGTLSLVAAPGSGTDVTARIPLGEAAAEAAGA